MILCGGALPTLQWKNHWLLLTSSLWLYRRSRHKESVCISVRTALFQSCELRKHANIKLCLKSGLQYSNIPSKCEATDCFTYVKFDTTSVVRTENRLLKDALYSLHRLLGTEWHDRHKLPWSIWGQVQNFCEVTKGNRSVLQREQRLECREYNTGPSECEVLQC
jgi:hypothetical protein